MTKEDIEKIRKELEEKYKTLEGPFENYRDRIYAYASFAGYAHANISYLLDTLEEELEKARE